MSKKEYLVLVVVALVAGIVGAITLGNVAPNLSGSFAGGITPNQLWSADSGSQTVTPISGYGIYTNAAYTGGTNSQNAVTGNYVATATLAPVTLGPIGTTTSTATSTMTISIPTGNVSIPVGTFCEVSNTFAPTTTAYNAWGYVQANTSTASNSTTTLFIAEQNLFTAAVSVGTGTLHAQCKTFAI